MVFLDCWSNRGPQERFLAKERDFDVMIERERERVNNDSVYQSGN